jgi:hypothetical protein
MRNPMWKEDVKVVVNSFYYSWNRNDNRTSLALSGRIQRSDFHCEFRIQTEKGQHRLTFPTAIAHNFSAATENGKSEYLQELALIVKRALIDYMKNSAEIPFAYRQQLVNCIMTHHLQKQNESKTKVQK